MFNITTCRDFHSKLSADFDDFAKEQDSARLALNCIITAYHLHEWVWGDWLKTDYAAWKELGSACGHAADKRRDMAGRRRTGLVRRRWRRRVLI
jgi:hypothetical protein